MQVRLEGDAQNRIPIGWPLTRLGTAHTLNFGAAASQYLLAIGSLCRAMRFAFGTVLQVAIPHPEESPIYFRATASLLERKAASRRMNSDHHFETRSFGALRSMRPDGLRQKIAGASARAPAIFRRGRVTGRDPHALTAEAALHSAVVEFESHAWRRSRDEQSKSDEKGLHGGSPFRGD